MNRSTIYGIALLAGALGTVITMVFHPTGSDMLQSDPHASRAGQLMAVLTHSLALISYPVIVFGLTGLYREISGRVPLKTAALVSIYFGAFMVMIAGAASGLVAPEITREILKAGSDADLWHVLLAYNFAINQGFTKIFVVASSISLILWSLSIWSPEKYSRFVSITGFIVAGVSLLAFFAGHLSLDVHGFGLFAFAQAFWLILVGVLLVRLKN